MEAHEQKLYSMSPVDIEVDLESYQTALEGVLSWLLTAEDSLQAQGDISTDVEEVKEQFHTHEVCVNNMTEKLAQALHHLLIVVPLSV